MAISEKGGYPFGMAQPAVVVLKRDGGVLFSWAIVPGMVSLIYFLFFPQFHYFVERMMGLASGLPGRYLFLGGRV